MKKSMKFLALFLGFVVLSMFSGCKLWDEVKNAVGPTNKWLRYDYDYQLSSGSTVTMKCYLIYSDGNYSSNDFSTNFKHNYCKSEGKLPKGLTIVVDPRISGTTNAELTEIFGTYFVDKKYIAHTFVDGEDVEMEGTNGTFKMGYGVWALIYNSISLDSTSLPVSINKDSDFTKLDGDVNWKKLMAVMALQYVMNSEFFNEGN